MTFGIRLAALCAVPVLLLASAGSADALNRKAHKMMMDKAGAYCAQIKKREVYECSVEKCPCADGLREVKRFDRIYTRPACVCTPDSGRAKMNEADATDFCVRWNLSHAAKGDTCFVVEGEHCPEGSSKLRLFNRLRGRGPAHIACRGEPPKKDEEEEAEGAKKSEGPKVIHVKPH